MTRASCCHRSARPCDLHSFWATTPSHILRSLTHSLRSLLSKESFIQINLLSLTQGDPIPVLRLAPYLALAPHQMIQLTKLAENLERKFILNHHLWWDESQKNTQGRTGCFAACVGKDLPFSAAPSCSPGCAVKLYPHSWLLRSVHGRTCTSKSHSDKSHLS